MPNRKADLAEYIERVGPNPAIQIIERWETPASHYPRIEVGRARVVTRWYRGMYLSYGINGYDYVQFNRRSRITGLTIGGQVWMVDDPWHYGSMQTTAQAIAERCGSGAMVLVGGLGLGLIVHLLAEVGASRVVVVEREPDVVALIEPNLPTGLEVEIYTGTMEEYLDAYNEETLDPRYGGDFDAAFIDLWVASGREAVGRVFAEQALPLAYRTSMVLGVSDGVPVYTLGFQGSTPITVCGADDAIRTAFGAKRAVPDPAVCHVV